MKTTIAAAIAALSLLGTSLAHAAIDDARGKELMKKGGCGACHAVKMKVVGPSYKDVALKHKDEADAIATLSAKVRAGGKGVYGPVPMPPIGADKISDAELHDLVEWILSK